MQRPLLTPHMGASLHFPKFGSFYRPTNASFLTSFLPTSLPQVLYFSDPLIPSPADLGDLKSAFLAVLNFQSPTLALMDNCLCEKHQE